MAMDSFAFFFLLVLLSRQSFSKNHSLVRSLGKNLVKSKTPSFFCKFFCKLLGTFLAKCLTLDTLAGMPEAHKERTPNGTEDCEENA